LTVTGATPLVFIPSLRAAIGETSRIRFFAYGPRSVTVTWTDLPFLAFVTFAFVPRGSEGLAAVIRLGENLAPLAVLLPAASDP